MDKKTHQVEMASEIMNDDFSRHLGAAIYCFVNEIVKEVVEELKGQTTVAKNQSVASMPENQEYMTRKEVMKLLKRCDSTMTKWAIGQKVG